MAQGFLLVADYRARAAAEKASADREAKLQSALQETRLDSAKASSFLSGQLDMIQKLLSTPRPNQDLRQIAEAIRAATGIGSQQFTNAQLRDAALDLARRLREFQVQIKGESSRLYDSRQQQMMAADKIGEEEVRRVHLKTAVEIEQLNARQLAAYGPLKAEAQNMRTQLLNRLPPQPAPKQWELIALEHGALAGPNPVGEVADYIERLARLLAVK